MAEPHAILVGPQAITNSKDVPEPQPKHWIAAYTRPRHELVVASQFQQKGLDALLPTYRRLSRWSDRIRRIDAPLFPGYVFVRVAEGEHHRVLQTGGVVSIVCRSGKPVPLSDADVEKLQVCTANPAAVEPHPYLRVGPASSREAWSVSGMGRRTGREEKLNPPGADGRRDHEINLY